MDTEIRNDRLPAQERSNALQNVQAPLRDQIVQKLYNDLKDKEIGQYIRNQWDLGSAHRANWLERQEAYLSEWDDFLVSSTEGAFAGSSQLHIPITFIVCKALHARYLQALWQDPPFNVKARKAAFIDRVPVVRDVMLYTLTKWANYNKGVYKVVDSWVWKWVTAGSSTLKQRWEVLYTRFKDVRTIKKPGPIQYVVQNGKQVPVAGAPTEEEEEFDNTIKAFDGPVWEVKNHEDLLIIGGEGDPDAADEVHDRAWLKASTLWTLADRKIFNADAVKRVIESGRDYKSGSIGSNIKNQRSTNAGQASPDSRAEHDSYEIIESYMRLDVDGSGIVSDVVTWTHKDTGELLAATYLYRVNKTGRRPYRKADFHLRDGQEMGIGIPELMYPLQKEIDAVHNMRIDYGLVSTMPFGFYRATSSLDPKTIRLEPGALIPVDNPESDVYFPQLGNRSVTGFQEEQALDTLIQKLTGINDMAMGMLAGQGAARTATGARAVSNEVSANLDVHLRRLNYAWTGALEYQLDQNQQRMPKGLGFRITGEAGQEIFREDLSREDIIGDYDLEVSANSSTSNQGVQQEIAQQVLQLVSNPLAIQLGIVTPAQFYEAMKNQLQTMGVRDYAKYVQKPAGYNYVMQPVEEADALLGGMLVPILPNADHQGFIDFVAMFEKDELLHGQFQPEQMAVLKAQAARHQQMMDALQQMQAQQANAQQMRTNAAMSQQQAPTGMKPAEGSMGPPPQQAG